MLTASSVTKAQSIPTATINRRFVVLVSMVAALGGLLFGFDTAVISGTIPYITEYFQLDAKSLGWAVGCILIGCAIGALFAGIGADKYGRKPTLILCAILFAVSGIGAGWTHNFLLFVLFRMIGGLGVGAAAMVSPMYIAEIVPASLRGRLVALYQLAIVLGILLAYFSNYAFDSMGENNWRYMFASQASPAVLFLLLLLRVPETPRWLIKAGKTLPALNVLMKMNGAEVAKIEMNEITQSFSNSGQKSLMSTIKPAYKKVILIGICVAVFQQITGINAILYYAPTIFKATGLSNESSLLQTIGVGVVNVISTFIAIIWVDKVGRKKFLVTGSLIMGLSLIAVAACFHLEYFEHYIVLIFMLLYVGAFGCTLGAVTWVYLSEIFPNPVRGLALSIATLALWLADFIVTYTFPLMTQHLGTALTLLTYAVCCAAAFLYFVFRIKETKDRSLEEIESLFTQSS